MPVLIKKLVEVIGWSLIKEWAANNLLPVLAKWFVTGTSNKWDDKVYYLIMAIKNNEPTDVANQKLEELLNEITNAK